MIPRVFVNRIRDHKGAEVTLKGWVSNKRSSGSIHFLELRDGSGFIQIIAENKQLSEETLDAIQRLTPESAVEADGVVAEHPKRPGVFELHLRALRLVHLADEYPITKKEHGPDFLLENRHLWLRSKRQWAIQRIRNLAIYATYEFLERENFVKCDAPIIVSTACEGTTTLFAMDYFDLGHAYLSQSGQLYLEAAIGALGRVFDFGPVFRAEKSKTRKHLTEFWMMDAEMAFCDHAENLDLQERLMRHIIGSVLEKGRAELAMLERDPAALQSVLDKPFHRITHAEAVRLLREKGSEITEDLDLGAQDETLLSELFPGQMVFIERWPAAIKAFYMKRDPQDERYVLAADLMAPEGYGELIGGSQREDSYDLLLERMQAEHMPVDEFQWYLDTRRYGSVPHSGFGFGLERIVTWLAGAPHIRETIPFPRMIHRFKP